MLRWRLRQYEERKPPEPQENAWRFLETCIKDEVYRTFPYKSDADAEGMTDGVMALLTDKDKQLLTGTYRRRLGI